MTSSICRRGIVFAKSPIRLREALPEVLENVNENLTPRMRNLVAMLWSEWKDLELQIVQMNDEVERIASSDAACRRLRRIPGIGQVRGVSHQGQEKTLHLKAEYIDADFPSFEAFPL